MQVVQKLRGVIGLHNVLTLSSRLRPSDVACVLHFPSNGLLPGTTGSTAAQGRLVHITGHLTLNLVHVHKGLVSIVDELVLVSNIVHVANAIVMVMLDIHVNSSLRLLLRLLILSL